SQDISPFAICSKTIYSVIIFVILAGGNASSASFAYKTFPVPASTIIAVFAFVSIPFASVTSAFMTTKHANNKAANRNILPLYFIIPFTSEIDLHITYYLLINCIIWCLFCNIFFLLFCFFLFFFC